MSSRHTQAYHSVGRHAEEQQQQPQQQPHPPDAGCGAQGGGGCSADGNDGGKERGETGAGEEGGGGRRGEEGSRRRKNSSFARPRIGGRLTSLAHPASSPSSSPFPSSPSTRSCTCSSSTVCRAPAAVARFSPPLGRGPALLVPTAAPATARGPAAAAAAAATAVPPSLDACLSRRRARGRANGSRSTSTSGTGPDGPSANAGLSPFLLTNPSQARHRCSRVADLRVARDHHHRVGRWRGAAGNRNLCGAVAAAAAQIGSIFHVAGDYPRARHVCAATENGCWSVLYSRHCGAPAAAAAAAAAAPAAAPAIRRHFAP